ncbi:MAG: right-handed parallel beta-helix repeat-containing protein [Deltaproteobacteria bacterium]|nr:right-handed parallel beta-helix repeat-containing protein [Deltaproteobacteria bacterium]
MPLTLSDKLSETTTYTETIYDEEGKSSQEERSFTSVNVPLTSGIALTSSSATSLTINSGGYILNGAHFLNFFYVDRQQSAPATDACLVTISQDKFTGTAIRVTVLKNPIWDYPYWYKNWNKEAFKIFYACIDENIAQECRPKAGEAVTADCQPQFDKANQNCKSPVADAETVMPANLKATWPGHGICIEADNVMLDTVNVAKMGQAGIYIKKGKNITIAGSYRENGTYGIVIGKEASNVTLGTIQVADNTKGGILLEAGAEMPTFSNEKLIFWGPKGTKPIENESTALATTPAITEVHAYKNDDTYRILGVTTIKSVQVSVVQHPTGSADYEAFLPISNTNSTCQVNGGTVDCTVTTSGFGTEENGATLVNAAIRLRASETGKLPSYSMPVTLTETLAKCGSTAEGFTITKSVCQCTDGSTPDPFGTCVMPKGGDDEGDDPPADDEDQTDDEEEEGDDDPTPPPPTDGCTSVETILTGLVCCSNVAETFNPLTGLCEVVPTVSPPYEPGPPASTVPPQPSRHNPHHRRQQREAAAVHSSSGKSMVIHRDVTISPARDTAVPWL